MTEEAYKIDRETEQNERRAIRLSLDCLPAVNYALQQNRIAAVRRITVENASDEPIEGAELTLTAEPAFAEPYTTGIAHLGAGQTCELTGISLTLDAAFLAELTERVNGFLLLRLSEGGEVLAEAKQEITALAFDEWHGSGVYPELLASFVTPNHPAAAHLLSGASAYLERWTGDPSLDAYQTQNPDRVRKMAAAIFEALRDEGVVYCVSPASFETSGQRVRLCDAVLEQRMGSCLDLTLLYASALEAAGLHPLLILTRGHIFTGVWLSDLSFPESVQDDGSVLTKRLAAGVNEIAVAETTMAVRGSSASFDDASARAEEELAGVDPIALFIDVRRARLSGIAPLPMRIHLEGGWKIEQPESSSNRTDSAAPREMWETLDVAEEAENGGEENVPKLVQWERKLLDLGLRNSLINLRYTRSLIPLLTPSPDELEDALSDGGDFTVYPRPADYRPAASSKEGENGFESIRTDAGIEELIRAEFKNKRLRSVMSDAELSQAIKALYRTARTSLEENGANSLYLALGLLRWYETPKSARPRYAPVVLLPVEIIRRSAAQGYAIRLRDDEPQMNVTILEKIKQDFGITVNGLDPLPGDEHGVDVRRVFTILRRAVMGQSRWDVLECACLGIFSFSQFVMWNDLRSRSGDLMKNKLVKSLTDGRLCWDAHAMELGERVPEDGVLLPLSADASQLFAIEAACAGESFVLHGPPGTGKSQTITSLIANALAQGKSVLFVAEKMAALSVVQNRLEKIGVGPFCLELHSNKSKKKDVLEQLRRASEVTKTRSPEEYARAAEQIAGLRAELDSYAEALHRVREGGSTLHQLIGAYEAYRNAPEVPGFTEESFRGRTRAELENASLLLERLAAAGRALGHPKDHPLSPLGGVGYSQQLRRTLPETVNAYRDALGGIREPAEELARALHRGNLRRAEDLESLGTLAEELSFWYGVPEPWIGLKEPQKTLGDVRTMAEHYRKAETLHRSLSVSWNEMFFRQNAEQLLAEYSAVSEKWLIPRLAGLRAMTKKLSVFARGEVNRDGLESSFLDLWNWQMEKNTADTMFDAYGEGLGGTQDWGQVAALAEETVRRADALRTLTGNDELRLRFASDSALRDSLREPLERFREALPAFREAFGRCRTTLAWEERDTGENWIAAQLRACERVTENTDSLKEYLAWRSIADEAERTGLSPMVAFYRAGAEHEALLPAWNRARLSGQITLAIEESEPLNGFSGSVFNEKIEQYRRIDAELTELSQEEIFCRLAAKVPDFVGEAAQSSEVGILQRMLKSGGRGTSIRRLFESIPNLLPRLCPCMLMSPISAAQYLQPGREPFDIVVFDEASQLPTCQAVGVLARGKNAVIVGDPKQMPPTSFFAANAEDEDHPELEDLESILDDCLALNMPQTHLLWHYRSRHESLIAFSNRQFYENRLYTFPSVNDRESKVTLEKVGGVFDRGKTRRNAAEARAVVDELIRRSRDPVHSAESVGVVTFNISQQNLIEDLLNEACRTDAALEKWAFSSEEPVFIKNLENVQGDERDVILFSVGYGPDANGKVSLNFGPLNREGGWRRLNVAVTRARCEMKVFTSLTPDSINLNQTSAEGVAALRAFLEYAAGKKLSADGGDSFRAEQEARAGVAGSIAAFLRENGWDAELAVGHSAYRIDVGAVDPAEPDRYLLGILLDGEGYGEAKTTRDRELGQIGVLEGLGWRLTRVWTMDWWDNREKETERLLRLLREAREDRRKPAELPAAAEITEAEAQPDTPDETEAADSEPIQPFIQPEEPLPEPGEERKLEAAERAPEPVRASNESAEPVRPYRAANLHYRTLTAEEFAAYSMRQSLAAAARKVLDTEAPVSRSLLLRRVLQSFGIARAGSRTSEVLDAVLAGLGVRQTTTGGGEAICWRCTDDPAAYRGIRTAGEGDERRDAKEIPTEEAANAVVWVLYRQIGLPRDDLIREAAKRMGYPRLGSVVSAKFASAVEYAVSRGWVQEGGSFTLTPEGNGAAEAIRGNGQAG